MVSVTVVVTWGADVATAAGDKGAGVQGGSVAQAAARAFVVMIAPALVSVELVVVVEDTNLVVEDVEDFVVDVDVGVVVSVAVDVAVSVVLVPVEVGAADTGARGSGNGAMVKAVKAVVVNVEDIVTVVTVETGSESEAWATSMLLLSTLDLQSRWMYSPATANCATDVPCLRLAFVRGYASLAKLGSLMRQPSSVE